MTKPAGLVINRFGLLTGLNRSTIKPVKPTGFGFGSTVFKTLHLCTYRTDYTMYKLYRFDTQFGWKKKSTFNSTDGSS
jgi:hypothetical protein